MNGFIPKRLIGLGLGCGLAALAGCSTYRELVDPCWPERYNAQSRSSVTESMNAQAANGHALDQTVWNHQFERDPKSGAPTAVLNPQGIEHLKYIARRRPAPDGHVFLQTANDLPYNADAPPEQFAQARADLDNKRIVAVQKFLAAHTNGHAVFTVDVHDPAEVGVEAIPIGGTLAPGQFRPVVGGYQKLQDNFQGALQGVVSPGSTGGSGSQGGGSGQGGSGSQGGGR